MVQQFAFLPLYIGISGFQIFAGFLDTCSLQAKRPFGPSARKLVCKGRKKAPVGKICSMKRLICSVKNFFIILVLILKLCSFYFIIRIFVPKKLHPMNNNKYPHLTSPIQLGKVTFRNRIFSAPWASAPTVPMWMPCADVPRSFAR